MFVLIIQVARTLNVVDAMVLKRGELKSIIWAVQARNIRPVVSCNLRGWSTCRGQLRSSRLGLGYGIARVLSNSSSAIARLSVDKASAIWVKRGCG
eukprot:COSAG01_NODE_28494_length_659_cov_3.630357_2_plen_96_part_00